MENSRVGRLFPGHLKPQSSRVNTKTASSKGVGFTGAIQRCSARPQKNQQKANTWKDSRKAIGYYDAYCKNMVSEEGDYSGGMKQESTWIKMIM